MPWCDFQRPAWLVLPKGKIPKANMLRAGQRAGVPTNDQRTIRCTVRALWK